MSIDLTPVDIEYPESDGKPMGETDLHRDWIIRIIQLLKHRFRGNETYVSGDLLVYYVEGDPRTFIVPDAFIVKGGGKHRRRTYKLWEEGRPPNIAFEVTSLSTRQNDIDKFAKYQQIGVQELFLYDPTADYLTPPLQGFRLGEDDYHAIPRDDSGRIRSHELDADLCLEDDDLVIYDAATGHPWQTAEEAAQAERAAAQAEREAAQAEREAARAERDSQLARVEQLEAELRRLREQLDD